MRIFPPVKEAAVIALPAPKPEILARRAEIVTALRALVPGDGVIAEGIRLKPYETDGLAAYRQMPLAVVLPSSTAQVAAVLRYCHEQGIRVVPRGAPYVLRQGVANLHRPNNRTVLLLLALGLGTFLIVTLALTRATLLAQIEGSGGGDRPNLVFFDV